MAFIVFVFFWLCLPLLFYKLEREYWGILKTILLYLNKYPLGMLPDLEEDPDVKEEIVKI